MKDSQKNINYNIIPFNINTKVLISSYYKKINNTLDINLSKTGKKIIPGIISGNEEGYYYPIIISVDYKDLKKDKVYSVDYRLLKSINENVYKEFFNKYNLNEDIELESDEDSIIDIDTLFEEK